MVAHQVARPVPGHRDGPRGPYGGVGGRLAASARIHRFSRREPPGCLRHTASAANRRGHPADARPKPS